MTQELDEAIIEMLAKASAIAAMEPETNWRYHVASVKAVSRALLAAGYRKRSDVLEEAAKACEQEAQDFLSPEYAHEQPLSSINECWNCGGEGFVASCFEEWACMHPDEGCDICIHACEICTAPKRKDTSQ